MIGATTIPGKQKGKGAKKAAEVTAATAAAASASAAIAGPCPKEEPAEKKVGKMNERA